MRLIVTHHPVSYLYGDYNNGGETVAITQEFQKPHALAVIERIDPTPLNAIGYPEGTAGLAVYWRVGA